MQGEICAPLTCLLGEEDIIHCLKISLTPFIFDLLQAKLNTTNQQMRHTAIKVLGESEYDPATPILLYHWEKFPADQDEVLKALTILADKRAAPALNHALTIATASDKYNILNPITAIGDPIVLETLLREAAHENCKLYSFTGLANFPKNELAELALLTFLDKVDTQWNDIASISRALQSVGSHHSILPLTHKLIKAKLALPDRDAATACKFIIKTLGELGNQETAKILVEYCEFNDKDTTLAIIEALGNLKSADSIAFLRQAITTETALEIAKALGKINTKESRAILIDMIKSDENKIIEAGINAVGEIGSKDAVSVLIQQISNASQRRSALKVLKKIGDPAMADELYDFAVKQSNKSFMPEVWSLLGYIGDKRAFPVLLGYLKKTNLDVSHKKSVILALGQHGNMDACKMLRSMLGKEPAVVTGAILHALGQLKDDKDFPLLARAINSPIRAEVSGAVSGLEYFNTKQSVVLLISALDSVWPDVQKKARLVLVRNGHPLGTEALIEGLNSPYPNRQQEYAKSLGASLDDKIIEVLIKTLNSPHQQLRITVIKALANTNTPEAKKSIEKMLNDPCRMVRNAAFEALNNHHNKSFQPGWNMNFDDLEETINDLNEKMINAHLGINSNKENSLSFPPEKQFFQPARILNFL
jgi:HEAT repeat protein